MNIETLITYYTKLSEKPFNNISLEEVLLEWTNIKDAASEYVAQLYIAYTCDTQNEQKAQAYSQAIEKMEVLSPLSQNIANKIVDTFKVPLPHLEYAYKLIKNEIELYNKENIPLETQNNKYAQEYQSIIGSLTIEHEGKQIPLSMARPLLEKPDRNLRKEIFEKLSEAHFAVSDKIGGIFEKQVQIRHSIANHLNIPNFRDYMHQEKARFDYTSDDCLTFAQSILQEVVPVSESLHYRKKKLMQLENLEPFDTACDPLSRPALSPAMDNTDFFNKCLHVLKQVDPAVAETLENLNKNNQLDLFSRMGKAPGGYNYPLPLSKTSFIFMNSSLTHQDAVTLFHEVGHAYHFDLYKHYKLPFLYKSPSSEIAEVASMTMELMCMEHWDILYSSEEEFKRAKRQQLEGIIHFFPWMAVVDSFQHWIYLNPQSGIQERNDYFKTLYHKYLPGISWQNYKDYLPTLWQKQLHIIEVPFYYIEYGIAQLGALQLWKTYKSNPKLALAKYKEALLFASQGPISEAYAKADIKVDFSANYIKEIIHFIKQELDAL